MQVWWNGRHSGFRNQCRKAWRFDSSHLYYDAMTERFRYTFATGIYVGSNPTSVLQHGSVA